MTDGTEYVAISSVLRDTFEIYRLFEKTSGESSLSYSPLIVF